MAPSALATTLADKLVAVVGAGAAGLACASRLAEHGFLVTVFDSGRGPGGRMSQRREKGSDGSHLYFDHGAQYFTVKDPMIQGLVDNWEEAGFIAEWKGKFGTFDAETKSFSEDTDLSKKRYVGVPGMNAICQALSQKPGVEAKFCTTVAKLDWLKERKLWMLADKDGNQLGEFWAVVATDKNMASPRFLIQTGLPPPLAGAVPTLSEKVSGVSSSSSFACMLAFPLHLTSISFDGFTVVGSKVLAWAARDSSKPKRNTLLLFGDCWVLHSTSEFAEEVIQRAGMGKPSDELLSMVAQSLLEDFRKIGEIPSPVFIKAHRWGSAFPKVSIAQEERCLLDEVQRLAVCGDFCLGPRVECAILSGLSAAEKIWGLAHSDAKL
ncbi:hypothetical protein L7F22_067635 [Adiantum nelumboides]|nr:hypothetical protein [Adiantum nelumboides]